MPPRFFTELPLRAEPAGVRVAVRLTPRAHADRVDGIAGRANGEAVLKVSLTAPPVENRANEALLRLLAKAWRIPRRDLTIVAGGKSRDKIVRIAGDPASLTERLRAALTAVTRGEGG